MKAKVLSVLVLVLAVGCTQPDPTKLPPINVYPMLDARQDKSLPVQQIYGVKGPLVAYWPMSEGFVIGELQWSKGANPRFIDAAKANPVTVEALAAGDLSVLSGNEKYCPRTLFTAFRRFDQEHKGLALFSINITLEGWIYDCAAKRVTWNGKQDHWGLQSLKGHGRNTALELVQQIPRAAVSGGN